jgi:acetyltransferase-like isoleucine patch superfamily enzyme
MREPESREIGENVVFSPDTVLGENVVIGNNVTFYPKVTVGNSVRILDGAVVGRLPISTGNTNRPTLTQYRTVHIGAGSVIGGNAVLYTDLHIGKNVLVCDLSSIREGSILEDLVVVARGVMVNYGMRIGTRSRIMDLTELPGDMVIEEDVFVSTGVSIATDPNVYLSRFGLEELKLEPPILRRFCVIGNNATLLPGVEVGEGAFVASGAVVSRDVEPWTIVSGIPARLMRKIPDDWRERVLAWNRRQQASKPDSPQ